MRLASVDIAASFLDDVLARDGAVWVSESSDSMAPLVRAGDRLRLGAAALGDLRPGQLVAFRRGGRLVVHRVVARDATGVVSKGDALSHRDAPVPVGDIVGRVTTVATPGGAAIALDAWPWPALGGLFALCSRAGEWAARSDRAPCRLAWKLTRLPLHAVAWWAR